MSKKFFSLIHGGDVHLAPGTKVIPEEAFSTVIDCQKILETVKEDVEQYRKEVAEECEKIKEQAQKEGFEEGFSKWTEAVAQLEVEIKKVRKDMEKVIIPIALKGAKKVVGRELEVSKDVIVDIIENALKAVSQHKKVTVWVNPKELDTVQGQRERLKKIFESLEALTVRPRQDIAQGGCVVETEAGIINAQIENQWMILENAFTKLSKEALKSEGEKA